MTNPQIDIEVEDHFTIFLFRPVSTDGHLWVAEHIDTHAHRIGSAVAVEHRFISALIDGATADGLRVVLH